MDDDIDIEEHDVMDNPRIKSIFPDLSCVKIEIPDEEEFEEQYDESPDETEESAQGMLYQYEYSFESTDDVPEESTAYEETEYVYNNQIILGSKPPVSPETLYKEALNSHPIIYLENWETRLKSSPCFCETCNILFPTVNALDAHKMINHSYLVALDISQKNTARKSTVTSKFCNHCSKMFPDDTSLIKHLYELLPLNNFTKPKEDKIVAENKEYSCQICKRGFPNIASLKWHEKSAHPPTVQPKKVKIAAINNKSEVNKPEVAKKVLNKSEVTKKVLNKSEVGKNVNKNEVGKVENKIVVGKNVANKTIVGKNVANKTEVGKNVVNKTIVGKNVANKTEVGKNVANKIVVGKNVANKTEVGKNVANKTEVGKTAYHKMNRVGKFYYSSLVPKSTLFQCRVCQICFVSCFSALQHTKACAKLSPYKKCGVCKRKIRSKDFKIHELQHTYSDKLKIYTVNKNIYEKVLCRCPKCQSCLDELGFWAHYKLCKKQEKRCYCNDCDVYIAANRYQSHRAKHSAKKISKKGLIIVEFHDQSIQKEEFENFKLKRLKERRREKDRLRKSKEKEIQLYYCETCGCCMYKVQFKGHANGICKGLQHKKICEDCGLCFTAKSIECHLIRHKKRSFTLKDIKIVSMFSGKQIKPPLPETFKCETCDIHFLYKRFAKHHECDTEKHETCKICFKKFNLRAYKVHKMFHTIETDTFMPELIEKYKSINNTWSVIYMCRTCDLVTVSYDSIVMHSQKHLNAIVSDNRKYCSKCDLQLAESDFANHELLHRNNESIERASFKILVYDYQDLFSKEWMTVFRSLPKQHRQQILSNSIYRFTRSVRLQIEKNGATDDTNYICMICKTIIEGPNIAQHLKTKCEEGIKFVCKFCNCNYKTLKKFIGHDCKVSNRATLVSFNNANDEDFDNRLKSIESRSKIDKNKVFKTVGTMEMAPKVKKSYIIYKCMKCQVCLNLKKSIKRHRCAAESDRSFCNICQQYITSKKIRAHMKAHRQKPSVNKNTLSVVYFNEEKVARNSTVNAKILKCQCGLHFTSLKSIHKHMDICKPGLKISKEVCSKCNLLFPTDVLVTHLVNHHSKEVKIDIETISRVNLYKCCSCFLLFTSQANFYQHMDNCDPKNGSLCLDCKLNFGKTCFAKHKCSSKGTHLNKIVIMKRPCLLNTVYQCETCEICYLNFRSFEYHLYVVKHQNKTALIICDSCGLRFTCYSYHKHEKFHTYGDVYKIKVISAISGDSIIISGRNKHKKVLSPKKRKAEYEEIENVVKKKPKTHEEDRWSKRLTKSKESINYNSNEDIVGIEEQNLDDSNENNMEVDQNNTSDDVIDAPDEITDAPDEITDAPDEKISSKLKARISVANYDNKLYKCIYCEQHFMKENSFDYHIKAYLLHSKSKNYTCEICGLDFSRHTLPRHEYIHHKGMGLNKDDFVILTDTGFTRDTNFFSKINKESKKLDKDVNKNSTEESDPIDINDTGDNCEDSVMDRNDSVISRNVIIIGKNISENGRNSNENNRNDVGRNESEISRNSRSISENGRNDNDVSRNPSENGSNISDNGRNDNDIGRNSSENGRNDGDIGRNISEIGENNNDNKETIKLDTIEKICYFKCADCNVCFIDKETCLDHTIDHKILDPKLYIHCKICDFQFMIDSLKDHMNLHHNTDYNVEHLTIYEYKPIGVGVYAKFDVYQAVDKVQSRLVSTTTDMGVV